MLNAEVALDMVRGSASDSMLGIRIRRTACWDCGPCAGVAQSVRRAVCKQNQ